LKHTRTYLFIFLLLGGLLPGCIDKSKRLPSLRETFSKTDKNPFGTNIAYRQLEAMYYNNTIHDKKESFSKTWRKITDRSSLYVCIAPALFVNEDEVDAMMDYVGEGNDLFISAGHIDELLLKRTGCQEKFSVIWLDDMFDSMKNTITKPVAEPESLYAYYYLPFRNYFSDIDSSNTRVLGLNENKQPNLIVYFYGKGKLFLHCDPRAFSNYFLLKENNYKYMQDVLAYTSNTPDHVYWDDYYNKINYRNDNRDFSAFREIMKHPPLVYAFWLLILLLMLYILFGAKRIQRIIEQRKANENTSVTFTETIGRLYLQKKNNKNISDKMVTYFNEYIRNRYFLNTNQVNDDFISLLSRKSGVERNMVESLYRTIVDAQNSPTMNDYQLLSLNEQIQKFHKTRN